MDAARMQAAEGYAMIIKFILWAAGVTLVALLCITGYGVMAGSLPWEKYLSLWTGIAGLVLGYAGKALESKVA